MNFSRVNTCAIPCLTTSLAMSIFVLFSGLFGHFEGFAFFENGGDGWRGGGVRDRPYTKAVKQDVFSKFFKVTSLK